MRVQDGMSPISAIVGPEHTLRQAAVKMVQNRTGAAIVNDGSLPGPGVITERDLLHAIAEGKDPAAERVGDHMTGDLITASPRWPLSEAASLMVKHGVRHVLVFDDAELVGVLSMRDVVRLANTAEWTAALSVR
ncbi:MAG: CBS domain-containing protein [Thermoleophilia bacterium]|jgi:CBS domain-containing protein|nr:CBS domain-containing protein [Thermoleophilia bacterium]